MSALPKHRMTIPEFLDWSAGREGKYLLVRGEVFAMAPESIQHARVKLGIVNAVNSAIRQAGLSCEAIVDGPGVAGLSPSTERFDSSGKLLDYIRHYVIVSLKKQAISHHKRIEGPVIPTQILRDGELVLDPPGIAISVADIFAAL